MTTSEFRALIRDTVDLPTLPSVALEALELIDDPSAGMAEVARIIGQDPPLTTSVLRTANSSIYGLCQQVKTIEHASGVLGKKQIRNLVLEVSVMRGFCELETSPLFDPNRLWTHAILTGRTCHMMATRLTERVPEIADPDELYLIGLLHDIGRFAMMDHFGLRYLELLTEAWTSNRPAYLAEKEELRFTHADVGGAIAEAWGLPEEVAFAIEGHHSPRIRYRNQPTTLLLMLADQVSNRVMQQSAGYPDQVAPDPMLMSWLTLEPWEMGELALECLEQLTILNDTPESDGSIDAA